MNSYSTSCRENDSTLRIGLLWHSLNSGNLGVAALTLANMELARQVARSMSLRPQFVVMGMRDGDGPTIGDSSTEVVIIDAASMVRPGGFWRAVGDVDCVLDIGAGDSFADIYGPKRFAFLWLTKVLALLRGKPLVFSPQTIGPFDKPLYRAAGAWTMHRATSLVARDGRSLDVAKAMAPGANAHLSVDVAFVLPYQSRRGEAGGQPLRIGVNASGLLFHQAETGKNRFALSYDYAAFTRQLIAKLVSFGHQVHLISHATSNADPTDDDGRLADRLAKEFPDVVRVPEFAGPSEAKSYISSLDFLVAGRMHACIGAYSAGVPVVPVAYSRKFSGLFGMLGHEWMVPVTGVDVDTSVAFVCSALAQRGKIANAQAEGMKQIDAMLDVYRQELRRTFALALTRQQVAETAA